MKMEYKKGVSIVEILVATSIVSMLFIIIASLYLTHFKVFANQNNTIEVNSQTRLALDDITNWIRQSQYVVSTCGGCSGATTGPNVLVLALWPLDGSGEPIDPLGTNYDYIVFKRADSDNTKMTRRIVPSALSSRGSETKVISTDISALNFTYNNPDPALVSQITAQVTATKTQFEKTFTSDDAKTVFLRNK